MPPVKIIQDAKKLVSTSEYPSYAHFPFEQFNSVQSAVFEVFNKDCNMIIAAKTSAGKTICAEMFLSNEIHKRGGKGIYLAPLKSLAKEKIDDWTDPKHHFFDLNLSICTGDYRLTANRKKEIEKSNLILMTSEMLCSRTRNYKSEKNEFLKDIGTVVVDESHLLTVPGRGDHLEVAMMKLSQIAPKARFVFLSATMPNVQEIAEWVSYSLTGKETYLLNSEYRPCPLEIHYETYWPSGSYENNEQNKVKSAIEIFEEYPDDVFLFFVHTKRTGEMLKKQLKIKGYDCEFHSSDLDKNKRHKVENKFKNKELRALIATSGVAWGCHHKNALLSMSDGTLKRAIDVNVGDELFSISKNYKKSCSKVVKIENKKCYCNKIKTINGEETIVSEDHLFLSAKGRNIPDYYCCSELNVGDFVAIPSCGETRNWNFDVLSYLGGYAAGDGFLIYAGTHADGSEKYVLDLAFDAKQQHIINFVHDKLCEVSDYSVAKPRKDKLGVCHICSKAKVVTDLFKDFLPIGRKCGKLRVPNSILRNRNKLISYLRGIFDSDGWVEDNSNGNFAVAMSSVTKHFAYEIKLMLSTLGIVSSIHKKKAKDSVINGRFQPAMHDSWVVRCRNKDAKKFGFLIGFEVISKNISLSNFKVKSSKNDTWWKYPVRNLVKDHANKNNISPTKMLNECGQHFFHLKNTNEITDLNKMVSEDIRWTPIESIEKIGLQEVVELELDNDHNYFADGFISHNCNFPARRVVILGVHRGINEVDTYDIFQMVGRSGRPGYDPRGDAYILLPENRVNQHMRRLEKPQKIESRLLDLTGKQYKTLAFHLVSEIHHGYVKNKDDVHDWYEKSLAHFQAQDLNDEIVDQTLESLFKCSAIKEEEGVFKVNLVGLVSSMFYYSPFDISNLKKNMNSLFKNDLEGNDLIVSMCLGGLESNRMGIVSKAERVEIDDFKKRVHKIFGKERFNEAEIKAGYVYYNLMNGMNLGSVNSFGRTLQWDFPRLSQVLIALDKIGCKWHKESWINNLEARVTYGVRAELLPLCKISDIGRVRAERLWTAGIRNAQDIVYNKGSISSILKISKERANNIVNAATNMIFL